ncbi:S8 family serine peptidase [Spongiactinospora rosea]|nr:S8 family serine peptidase [Spongiactinospora rosea]
MSWRRWLIGCAVPALLLTGSPAAPATAAPVTVTLITGDKVTTYPGGATTTRPGPGRSHITFERRAEGGAVRVVPSDAAPLVAAGRVDERLFDITYLAREGYDDASRADLPLILRGTQDSLWTLGAKATGTTGMSAVVQPKQGGRLWPRLVAGQRALAPGLTQVWLDGKVRASLDKSTAQIGAPAVWKSGYTGAGVRVAVLDTGVDAAHPDLVGQVEAAQSLVAGSDAADRFGHGTHVAAIIAGTGAASGGARKGVAPGARLLSGKVLGDDGAGHESWAIAGMEWAVRRGADVVNLSFGGCCGDGTDPMSVAVDTLTETEDVLFVAAAGNRGQYGMQYIDSPAAATKALAVGAVDRRDRLTPFSSRGPRHADHAVKPDLTAPGAAIVSARAAGTGLGTPVDDHYTAADGTSMAAPHVAGAAALLAQARPDLGATGLKDTLTSTASDGGARWFEQGAGRVDVARAIAQRVHADTTVGFGGVHAEAAPVTREITYRNDTARPVSLRLATAVTDEVRRPAGLALSAKRVTVRPGGTATVGLTLDPAALKIVGNFFGGVVTATAPGVRLRTTVGFHIDHPPAPALPDDWAERATAAYRSPEGRRRTLAGSALSPDGTQLFLFGNELLLTPDLQREQARLFTTVIDTATRKPIWTVEEPLFETHEDQGGGLVVAPDGGTVYVSGDAPSQDDTRTETLTIAYNNRPPARPGDPALGRELWRASFTTGHIEGVTRSLEPGNGMRLGISPDGRTVVLAGAKWNKVADWESLGRSEAFTVAYDARTGEQKWYAAHKPPGQGMVYAAMDLAVSPDGGTAYVTGFEQIDPGRIHIRPITFAYALTGPNAGRPRWVRRHDSATGIYQAWHSGISADGRRVFVAGTLSPDEDFLDTHTNTHALDAKTGRVLWTTSFAGSAHGYAAGHTEVVRDGNSALAVSPRDDLLFVTGQHCEGGTCTGRHALVTIAYDQRTGAERWHRIHESPGRPRSLSKISPRGVSAAVSGDGTRLYVAGTCCWSNASGDESTEHVTIAYDTAGGKVAGFARHKFEPGTRDDSARVLVGPDQRVIHTLTEVWPPFARGFDPSYIGLSQYAPPAP